MIKNKDGKPLFSENEWKNPDRQGYIPDLAVSWNSKGCVCFLFLVFWDRADGQFSYSTNLTITDKASTNGNFNRIEATERITERIAGDRIAFYSEYVRHQRVHGQYQPVVVDDHQSARQRIEDVFYKGVIFFNSAWLLHRFSGWVSVRLIAGKKNCR